MTSLSVNAQDENFWIFLCFGQSNMAGSAPAEKIDSVVPEGLLSLSATNGTDGRRIGEWRKALPPICRQDTKLSPADYFGREILANAPAGTRVGIVSVAVEGCPLTFFDKDSCQQVIAREQRDWMNNILNQYDRNPYKRLVEMARLAQKDGVIKGILLHQGETDAYTPSWQRRVYKIYKDLQADLKLDSFSVPMLVGETVRKEYNGVCAHANPTIDGLVNRYHNIYVVTSEGCLPGKDNVHFSSEGYRELGRRYAEKYLERVGTYRKVMRRVEKSTSEPELFLNVAGYINGKRVLKASASSPLAKVDIVSFSGQTIQTISVEGGAKDVDIDLKELPVETLIFVFTALDGSSNTLKLEQ